MNKIFKKILFPTYINRYEFLIEKQWFRILSILFLLFIIFTITSIKHHEMSDRCWSNYQKENYSSLQIQEDMSENCVNMTKNDSVNWFVDILLTFIFMWYVLPFLFFRIVIDYIMLNKKLLK